MPTISVIIPTYNRKNMLMAAIKSVLNQTYKDFEIIVIDGASTDGTQTVMNTIKNKRLRYIRHEKNRGLSAAKNAGIKASKGRYIAFLDDDDEYLPNKLERQIEKLENCHPDVGLVYTGHLLVNNIGQIIGPKLPSKNYWRGLTYCDFIGPTPLVRKKCFEEVGLFDENLHCYEDREMWLRLSDKYSLTFVKEPLYKMRVHGGRITFNIEKRIDGLKRLHLKHIHRIESASNNRRKHIYFQYRCQMAKILMMKSSNYSNSARKETIEAVKLKPFSIEGYKLFVLTLLNRHILRLLSSLLRRFHIPAFWWYE